jgi:hypothetical protein
MIAFGAIGLAMIAAIVLLGVWGRGGESETAAEDDTEYVEIFATTTDERGKIAAATRIDYVPTKKAYFAANTMGMTAKTILPEGVVRLHMATNAALSLA